jgi:hypothetical protein
MPYPQVAALRHTINQSELIRAAFGSAAGTHARTAIGVAALPLNLPVVISAELEIRP